MANSDIVISAAVEGDVDEAVVRKLITHVGAIPGDVHGKRGKQFLRARMRGYNQAAQHTPWVVLVDLDGDTECPVPLREMWVPEPAVRLCFRVAVREVESWLLGDREMLAKFLGVAREAVPHQPESLDNPKERIVNIARSSRHVSIRADIVPQPGSGRSVGPAYTSRMIEFVNSAWRPDDAAQRCDSLHRAIECLKRLATVPAANAAIVPTGRRRATVSSSGLEER